MDYNLQMNPSALGQLDKLPVDLTLEGMEWMNRARGNDLQTSADLPSLISHEQRMRPMREQQLGLTNEMSLAQLPGVRANSSMLGRKNKMEEATFDDDMKLKFKEIALKASDSDMKMLENEGIRMTMSNDPEERYKGAKILAASKEMFKAQQDHFRQQERDAILHRYKMAETQAGAQARASAGAKPRDFISALDKMKKASERAQALTTEIAGLPSDDPRREVYGAMLEALGPQIQSEREDAAARGSGGWVKDQVSGKWTPYVPPVLEPGVPLPGNKATADRPARQAMQPPMYAVNPKTKERIQSTDGGKTWTTVK